MKLDIKFGIDFEIKRVYDTLGKSKWFKEYGYSVKLPKNIDNDSSEQDIKNQIGKEFQKDKYLDIENEILSGFSKVRIPLSGKIKEVFGGNNLDNMSVDLTAYGTGGSYNLPNNIVFNIHNAIGFRTIIHEIIHIFIEPYIKKYNIEQWEKERVVDLVLNSPEFDFLKYNHWQDNYHETEKYIDSLFKDYFFKDIDEFFSKVEVVRQKWNLFLKNDIMFGLENP